MYAVTWSIRWGALVALAALMVAPAALAQNDDERKERTRVTIRMDADSIRVERDGTVTVVPNTPEGRAQLDEEDLGFGTGRFRIDMDAEDFGLDAFGLDGDAETRVFRFRSDGEGFPGSFGREGTAAFSIKEFGDGPRMAIRRGGSGGLALFDIDKDMRWTAENAEAQAEIMEMELQARQLARDLRDTEGGAREDLEEELDTLLADLFDLKLEQQRARVEALEAELSEERVRLEERQDARAEVIERRKRQLLGDDVLEW